MIINTNIILLFCLFWGVTISMVPEKNYIPFVILTWYTLLAFPFFLTEEKELPINKEDARRTRSFVSIPSTA